MENNLINEAIDKIKSLKVDIPNIAIVLGSGLGNFIHWIENPTFVNFEEIPEEMTDDEKKISLSTPNYQL